MTRVMVIDDDQGIRRLASFILDLAGYEVSLARHGQEALSMLNEVDTDVIILDLNMPVMDGYTFVHNLDDARRRPPIIILSGDRAEKAREELGAEAYIRKPFRPDELVSKVSQLTRPGAARS